MFPIVFAHGLEGSPEGRKIQYLRSHNFEVRAPDGRGLPLIDIRLAQRDPAELAGVYFPDHDRRCLSLYAPDWVRQVCEKPGLVFLDEINAAVTRLHQAAAYQIVLEHRVGPFKFHPDTLVLAAGNLEEDNAIVAQLSSALCNRFVHYTLRVDTDCW